MRKQSKETLFAQTDTTCRDANEAFAFCGCNQAQSASPLKNKLKKHEGKSTNTGRCTNLMLKFWFERLKEVSTQQYLHHLICIEQRGNNPT